VSFLLAWLRQGGSYVKPVTGERCIVRVSHRVPRSLLAALRRTQTGRRGGSLTKHVGVRCRRRTHGARQAPLAFDNSKVWLHAGYKTQ
jgi:hypothetical protein